MTEFRTDSKTRLYRECLSAKGRLYRIYKKEEEYYTYIKMNNKLYKAETPTWQKTDKSCDCSTWPYCCFDNIGRQGRRGGSGKRGCQGPQGKRGDPGEAGVAGAKGPPGDSGSKGGLGDAGPKGPAGLAGPPGVAGENLKNMVTIDESTEFLVTTSLIKVIMYGGGGAGGSGSTLGYVGGGGGSGGYIEEIISVVPGVYSVNVGAGGLGVAMSPGNDGGDTIFLGRVAAGGKGGQSYMGTSPSGFAPGGVGGLTSGVTNGNSIQGGHGNNGFDVTLSNTFLSSFGGRGGNTPGGGGRGGQGGIANSSSLAAIIPPIPGVVGSGGGGNANILGLPGANGGTGRVIIYF